MNVNEKLKEEIKHIAKESKRKRLLLDINEPTRYLDEYRELWKWFNESKWKKFERSWKFSQLVREILEPRDDQKKFMYERLWYLLIEYRNSPNDYFEVQTDDATYSFPNPLAELSKLEMLYEKFVLIFTDIKNRIDFDFPSEEYSGSSIRGKISWQKTILKSRTDFPLKFYSKIQEREYETPENILLILCVEWMYRDAIRVIELDFPEPLDDQQTGQIDEIISKTRDILLTFPYASVLNTSKRLWNLNYRTDPKILELEKAVRKRLDSGTIGNKKYYELLEWVMEYRELYLDSVNEKLTTTRPITSIEAQDYIFEAWIFFEMIDFIERQKGIRCYLTFGTEDGNAGGERFFTFRIHGVDVRFYYEKVFGTAAGVQKPDFSVMVDEKVIFVLDAKNFSRSKESVAKEGKNQIIAYMLTLMIKNPAKIVKTSGFILPYLAKDPLDDPGYYKIHFMKMTPEQDKVPENFQTLEKIFDTISDSVMQLKS